MLITFIGGGNMASALISGLANPPRSDLRIRVVDPAQQVEQCRFATAAGTKQCDDLGGLQPEAEALKDLLDAGPGPISLGES